MLIPLTPIHEAWNLEPTKTKSVSKVPIGYSNDEGATMYDMSTKYVPRTLDVSIRDQQVIEHLMPLTNNKRTNIVTQLLTSFFGGSGQTNTGPRKRVGNLPSSSSSARIAPGSSSEAMYPSSSAMIAPGSSSEAMYPSSTQNEEFFQGSPLSNDDSVQLIIMALVAYILFDKITTIWARSS
jgi:hypothetical protein